MSFSYGKVVFRELFSGELITWGPHPTPPHPTPEICVYKNSLFCQSCLLKSIPTAISSILWCKAMLQGIYKTFLDINEIGPTYLDLL